jgi:rhodanese-related sulfurtransferase/DNA-binding MarR family transcriptional regulator
MEKREFKTRVYSLLAQMIKAMSNPHRLEIIDLLGQGGRTVEEIAGATDISIANASQHLQVLKGSNLVAITREGNYIRYRLADEKIYAIWSSLRAAGFERIAEIEKLARDYREKRHTLEAVSIDDLLVRVKNKNVVIIDVRPEVEYIAGHIPGSLSVPIEKLSAAIKTFSKSRQYIAYCRGPLCVFADEAVSLLTKKGFNAKRLEEGFPDWKLRGLPVETLENK